MAGSPWLLGLVLLERLAAGPPLFTQAAFVNRCRSPSTRVCDFVCDCWDCSDENQCGYQKESVALGSPFACDFEGSLCGWEDVSTSAYRWEPAQASLATWGKEPPFDHTLGTDLGRYLTTSKQRVKPSAVARLRSPFMREAAATCEIRAWYHLWGPGLNETHQPILTLELSQGSSTATLWRNPPSSVYPWRELVAYTGRIHGAFQVTFSSNASETVQLALDDVAFRNCGPPRAQTCGPDEFLCRQGGCIARDRLCDRTEDCRDGEDEAETTCKSFNACDFEQDWCGWAEEPNKSLSWARSSSLQGPPSHAWPTRDHSTNSPTGSFAYVTHVPSRGLQRGDAWLISPTLQVNGSCQLVLYVHLYASNSNRLNIYYRTGETMKLVRTRAGDLGDYWVREKVDFQVEQVTFQIVIEGVIGTGHKGSVALDDLVLSPGCSKQGSGLNISTAPDPHMPCSQDQFACNDSKQCIDVELVCNFKADCVDLSDEWSCGATSFASGTGGWTDVSVGRLQWALRNASSRPDSAGPVFSLQDGPGQMLSLAKAATPALGPSGLACALEMNFTTGPQGILALAVADESLGTRRWVWYELGNGTATWTWVRVPVGARARPFQLELLAMADLRGPGDAPLPAVSDVALVGCSADASLAPAPGLSCNFERDWCGWFMEQNDGFEWERLASGGWGMDHTTGTGSFLSVDPSAPGAQGLSARLISSPQVAAANASCLSFWYRMDGPQIGTLNLLVKYGEKPEQVLWTRTGSQGAAWHLASSTLSHQLGQNYQVVFEALRDGFLGAMALDDVSERPGGCGAQKRCTFETNDCGLLVSQPQAWVRQDGAGRQGPPTDHTRGTPEGHYMFINTSASALHAGQTAVLRSQGWPPLLGTHCVTFWYYLSSRDPGSLSVSVEEGGTQKEKSSVRTVQAEGWQRGSVTAKVQADWQVAFVVEGAGGGPASFLALDDLHVEEGVCLEAGSCDFESGTCGWGKPHGGWYSWDWKEGAAPALSPSPKEDHTLGTEAGRYAYVDVAVLGLGGRTAARLASEPLPSTTGSCLQFHYHMDFVGGQSSQAELRVKLSGPQGERTVWSATGHQSWAWLNQTVLVSSPTEFQIVLEATSGAWPSSGTIAVDDISYAVGPGCDDHRKNQVGGESSPGEGSVAGLVAGMVCSILLVLVATAVAIYCLRKPRAAGGRMPEESSSITGFDNVTFRDDAVIIPRMPVSRETE